MNVMFVENEDHKPYLGDDSLAKATQANAEVWAKRFTQRSMDKRIQMMPSMMNEVQSLEVLVRQKEEMKKQLTNSLKKIELEIATLNKEIDTRRRVVRAYIVCVV
jgi:hypothetical protein